MIGFNLETIGAAGSLDAALEFVKFELMKVDLVESNRLAVEVYKAWLNAAAIDRQTATLSRIAEALETERGIHHELPFKR